MKGGQELSSLFMIAQDGSLGCQSIQDSVTLASLPFSKAEWDSPSPLYTLDCHGTKQLWRDETSAVSERVQSMATAMKTTSEKGDHMIK